MKVAVLDCSAGISGDMAVAAFLDARLEIGKGKRLDLAWLKHELKGLKIKGYSLGAHRVMRGGLSGLRFEVHTHSHHKHHHQGRIWRDIRLLLRRSKLSAPVKDLSEKILHNIAIAEAKIHRKTVDKVHFHEVGAVDSIMDVVSFALCFTACGIKKLYARNITVGSGAVLMQHGKLPVPAPATVQLLKDFPVRYSKEKGERITPTGAAFLKTVAEVIDTVPVLEVENIGYGAGSRNPKGYPNLLRLTVGEAQPSSLRSERILLVETNLDDIRPLDFELVYKRLFSEGALDVFVQPILMKKMRPAYKLSCIIPHERIESIERALFEETPTLGVRVFELDRAMLERKRRRVRCRYGEVNVVVGTLDGRVVVSSPEYRECRRLALRKKIPFRRVYEEAKHAATLSYKR